jgi:hypothetical protein
VVGGRRFLDNAAVHGRYALLTGRVPPRGERATASLTAKGISWKYYGGGFDAEGTGGYFDGSYCDVCNPFQYQAAYPLMLKDHMRDVHGPFCIGSLAS